MRAVVILYWIIYPLWEWLKVCDIKMPMWLAVKIAELDCLNFVMIPASAMAIMYVYQEKINQKWLFYGMASFYARLALWILGIEFETRDHTAYKIYLFVFVMAIVLEKPFRRKAEDIYNRAWHIKNEHE